MKDYLIKLGIAVGTAVSLAILAKTWELVPSPKDYRIPKGTIAAFALTEPPNGWEVYVPAKGRFILGAGSPGVPGVEQTGGLDASKLLPDVFVARTGSIPQGGNNYLAPNSNISASLDARPPFISLLICRKL